MRLGILFQSKAGTTDDAIKLHTKDYLSWSMTLTQQIYCVEGPIFREYSANPKLRTFDQNDDYGIADNAFLQFCAHAGLSVL